MSSDSQRRATPTPAAVRTVDAIVVGAGHAGLAMSHALSGHGIDHVVIERGEVASAWRERWDSLRLLTPNWQTRLPSYAHESHDPDGFMTRHEVVAFLDHYARRISAPVSTGTEVFAASREGDGYRLTTSRGRFQCRALVLASGAHALPHVPGAAAALPASVASVTAHDYRRPERLDARHVLVVGASATGVQLAHELLRAGRQVTLSVGEHVRMPRHYRGLDIQRWLHAAGVLDQRYDQVDDIVRARHVPSPQLAGTAAPGLLDLNALRDLGARVAGRLVGVADGKVHFSGALRNHCVMADLKLNRLLDALDRWALEHGCPAPLEPERFAPTQVDASPPLALDLGKERIDAVLWATGSRPDFGFLRVPCFDRQGRLRHDGGVVDAPGLYALGLPFLRRRKSTFIHGAEDDVRDLSVHLARFLDRVSGASRAVGAVGEPLMGPAAR